ncbi:LOW QUALITY PROTEIN: Fc receptor-like protein 6 [Trichechus inunguis]
MAVWLLLAQPDPVFERDILTQCQGQNNAALSLVKLYKDKEFLHFCKDNQPSMGTATVKSNGHYSHTGQVMYIPQGAVAWDVLQRSPQHPGTLLSHVPSSEPGPASPPMLNTVPILAPCERGLVTLRFQTKLHPQRSASQLLFSFHYGQALQGRCLNPELWIPGAKQGDSGLYWYKAATEGSWVQKHSPQLEIRVHVPMSSPLLTLQSGATGPGGDVVELLSSSLLLLVMSEQDSRNNSCEAVNSVSRVMSESRKLSLDSSWVLSTPTSSTWLIPWLPPSFGVMVITAALLGYFRPWRKVGL